LIMMFIIIYGNMVMCDWRKQIELSK
jgi:hypothetical protein